MAFATPINELIALNANGLLGKHPSWGRVRLGDVATVQNGAAFKSEYFNTEGRGVPLLRIRDILRGATETWYDGPYDDEYVVEPGDLIIGMDGDFNHALWSGPRALLNQRVCRLHIRDDRLNKEWAFYVLGGYLDAVHHATPSVTVKHLSSRTVAELPLPCPPRSEQDATVASVRTWFGRIEAGVDSFCRALDAASQLRLAVLRDAVQGEWPTVELKAALVSLRNGISVSRPAPAPPGVPIYRISAVRPMALRVDDIRYAPEGLHDYDRYWVNPGDLLFTRYSGNVELVGACARVPDEAERALHPDKLIRGVVDRSVAEPAFLELACSAGQTWNEIQSSRKTTAGQVGISGRELGAVRVPIPPLDVQRAIVKDVRSQLDAQERLETNLRAALHEADRLRRAIFQLMVTERLADAPTTVVRS